MKRISPSRWLCPAVILSIGMLLLSETRATAGVSERRDGRKAKRSAALTLVPASSERVVVTGSLIPQPVSARQNVTGPSPVYVITSERMSRMGVTSVSAALRRTGFGR